MATLRGVVHMQWERDLGLALNACDIKQANFAGVMMLRQMIELDGYTPEEAWNHFDSLCGFHLPEDLMVRARNRVAERYGFNPRGSYDTANKTHTTDAQVGT